MLGYVRCFGGFTLETVDIVVPVVKNIHVDLYNYISIKKKCYFTVSFIKRLYM